MRILPAALVLSAGLHTGAIAWVRTRHDTQAVAPRAVTTPIEIVPAEPPPMEVALLDDHSVSPSIGSAAPAPSETVARQGHASISTGHAGTATTTAPELPASPPSHSSMMDMRHPDVSHGISEDFITDFLARSKPLAPKAIEGERIQDDIARDEQRLHDPRWVANATPDEVASARESLEAHRAEAGGHELQRDGTGTKATHTTFVARVDGDGTAHITDEPNLQRHGLGATFDVTDALMRHYGDDPYASNKRKFLDDTREERYQIGVEYKHKRLAHSAQLMQQNIDRVWATAITLDARKRGLFELWDECAEVGSDDLTAGALAARTLVTGTIRSRLTGADAYTASELATLNAHRTSHARFDPYSE